MNECAVNVCTHVCLCVGGRACRCADCFVCTYEDCGIKLSGKFFDIDGMPYCEECKKKPKKKPQELLGGQSSSDDVLPPVRHRCVRDSVCFLC